MADFLSRNKTFIIVILVTFGLIFAGVALMSGGNSGNSTKIAESSVLIPEASYKTSGIVDGKYVEASSSSQVTLVEFGDYVCPACGVYAPIIKKILTDYSGKVTYVFRDFPLSYHTNAPLASFAAQAAGLQGKYWEMHDKLFENQSAWSNAEDARTIILGYAKELGLDLVKFESDLGSHDIKNKVQLGTSDGNKVGLSETPTFYLNGEKVTLTGGPTELEKQVSTAVNK